MNHELEQDLTGVARNAGLACVFLILALLTMTVSTATYASSMTTVSGQTLELCQRGGAAGAPIQLALENLGWAQQQGEELSDSALTAFTARTAVWHLAGVGTGPQWMRVWSREHRMATGLRRVLTSNDAYYRRYFFEYPGDLGVLEVSIRDAPRHAVIQCELVITADAELSFVLTNGDEQDQAPIKRSKILKNEWGAESLYVWRLDAEEISRLISQPFAHRYVISTISRVRQSRAPLKP